MIDGAKVKLRGVEFIIPPLTLDAFEKVADTLDGLSNKGLRELVAIAPAIVLPAMKVNYPDLTEEKLKSEVLDVGNVLEVLALVLSGTFGGMPKAKPGEAEAP